MKPAVVEEKSESEQDESESSDEVSEQAPSEEVPVQRENTDYIDRINEQYGLKKAPTNDDFDEAKEKEKEEKKPSEGTPHRGVPTAH